MPDWFYHPLYNPVVSHTISAENARLLTLRLMQLQANFPGGQRAFKLFCQTQPPFKAIKTEPVEAFGLHFPSPVGLAPGIDSSGMALPMWPMLNLGFVQLGPAELQPVTYQRATNVQRLAQFQSFVISEQSGCPGLEEIEANLQKWSHSKVPVGLYLRHHDNIKALLQAITSAKSQIDFFSVPWTWANSKEALGRIRRATTRPLLLRLSLTGRDEQLIEAVACAIEAGFDGCIAVYGASNNLLAKGQLHGPALRERALQLVSRVANAYGPNFPIVAGGGINTPHHVIDFLSAGATLVELYEGFVYAGPGLPKRSLHQLLNKQNGDKLSQSRPQQPDFVKGKFFNIGWQLLAIGGWILVVVGLLALTTAATIKLLPHETGYLGTELVHLTHHFEGRLVDFMAHNRVSFAGVLLSGGIIYIWMGTGPIRQGKLWAWWVLLLSVILGGASYFSYVGSGYIDIWHGLGTLGIVTILGTGFILAYPRYRNLSYRSYFQREIVLAWMWSSAGMGRIFLSIWALGMLLGGLMIFATGIVKVFVPQDLEFLHASVAGIEHINSHLVPFIAHDRTGFGGALISTGVAALGCIYYGLYPGARRLWSVLGLAWLFSAVTAIGVHPLIGYNSFSHLLPFLIKDLAFIIGATLLYKPIFYAPESRPSFPDFQTD